MNNTSPLLAQAEGTRLHAELAHVEVGPQTSKGPGELEPLAMLYESRIRLVQEDNLVDPA